MSDFNDSHMLMGITDPDEKSRWWLGRLVKVRQTTNTMFINFPSDEDIGVVVNFQTTTVGDHIEIYFPAVEKTSWLMVNDVYSQPDKK